MQRIKTIVFICTLVSGYWSMSVHATINFTFGVYTSDKPTTMVKKFRPVLNALESTLTNTLGEPVEIHMQVANSYADGIEQLVSGKVDFARFGPASYVQAKQAEPGISILAVESNKGKKTFQGVICVPEDSPLQHVSELRGTRFAFGDELSTIGRYLSQEYLLEYGITSGDLSNYEYLGRHDKVGMAVASGAFDAGALKESTFEKLRKKGVALRKIASFPNVTKPWISRRGLDHKLYAALRRALLSLNTPAALKALKKDGFLPGSDEDYHQIREAMLKNPGFF